MDIDEIAPRSLLGLNEEYAFVTIGSDAASFNPKKAAIDLLKVRGWRGLVKFLRDHGLNGHLAWCVYNGASLGEVFGNAPAYELSTLGKPLAEVLTDCEMPDYLDSSNEPDYMVAALSIREVMHLRDTLRGIVRLSTVATIPNSVIPTDLVSFHLTSGGRTDGSIDASLAGFADGGLLDAWYLENGDNRFETPQDIDFRLCCFPEFPDAYFVGNRFSFDPRTSDAEKVVRAACGYLAAASMDLLTIGTPRMTAMAAPDHIAEEVQGFSYSPSEGFRNWKPALVSKPWWKPICEETISAILKGRIALCENCGIPFIAERKGANTCSGSCRTELCAKRKAKPAR